MRSHCYRVLVFFALYPEVEMTAREMGHKWQSSVEHMRRAADALCKSGWLQRQDREQQSKQGPRRVTHYSAGPQIQDAL